MMSRRHRFLRGTIVKILAVGVWASTAPAGAAVEGGLRPRNEVQRRYYDTGRLRYEAVIRRGFLVRRRTFYRNGRLNTEYRYKNGRLVSIRRFYENGRLKSIWTLRLGKTRHYRRDGRPWKTTDRGPRRVPRVSPSSGTP